MYSLSQNFISFFEWGYCWYFVPKVLVLYFCKGRRVRILEWGYWTEDIEWGYCNILTISSVPEILANVFFQPINSWVLTFTSLSRSFYLKGFVYTEYSISNTQSLSVQIVLSSHNLYSLHNHHNKHRVSSSTSLQKRFGNNSFEITIDVSTFGTHWKVSPNIFFLRQSTSTILNESPWKTIFSKDGSVMNQLFFLFSDKSLLHWHLHSINRITLWDLNHIFNVAEHKQSRQQGNTIRSCFLRNILFPPLVQTPCLCLYCSSVPLASSVQDVLHIRALHLMRHPVQKPRPFPCYFANNQSWAEFGGYSHILCWCSVLLVKSVNALTVNFLRFCCRFFISARRSYM